MGMLFYLTGSKYTQDVMSLLLDCFLLSIHSLFSTVFLHLSQMVTTLVCRILCFPKHSSLLKKCVISLTAFSGIFTFGVERGLIGGII